MLNSVSLVGRMTKDILMLQAGENIKGSFTLAVNRDYKDKEGNTPCDFIECEIWNAGASFLEQYAGKGCLVSVQGGIRLNAYDDKDGNRKYRTYVQVDRCNLLATSPAPREEEFKALTAKPKKQTNYKKR